VQQRQQARGHPEADHEDREALQLVAHRVPAAADPERESRVGGGVGDRGQHERGRVRPQRRQHDPQQQVQDGVRHGRERADHGEQRDLRPQRAGRARRGGGAGAFQAPAHLGQRHGATQHRPAQPGDPADVVPGGAPDVDAAVGVVHPVDRHLVDPQPRALGEHQQLGVEEPAGVLHQGQQLVRHVGADRLEAGNGGPAGMRGPGERGGGMGGGVPGGAGVPPGQVAPRAPGQG